MSKLSKTSPYVYKEKDKILGLSKLRVPIIVKVMVSDNAASTARTAELRRLRTPAVHSITHHHTLSILLPKVNELNAKSIISEKVNSLNGVNQQSFDGKVNLMLQIKVKVQEANFSEKFKG